MHRIHFIIKQFWGILIHLPLSAASILYVLVLLLGIRLIMKLTYRFLWKALLFLVCCILSACSKIVYFFIRRTKRRLWYWLDSYLFTSMYYIEKGVRRNRSLPFPRQYKFLRDSVTVLALCIAGLNLLASFNTRLPPFFSKPLNQYTDLEAKAAVRYELSPRPEKKAEPDMSPDNADYGAEPVYYRLNSKGHAGTNIRSTPELDDSIPLVTAIRGDTVVEWLNEEAADAEGRLWVKVRTPDGYVGWISKKLLEEVK